MGGLGLEPAGPAVGRVDWAVGRQECDSEQDRLGLRLRLEQLVGHQLAPTLAVEQVVPPMA